MLTAEKLRIYDTHFGDAERLMWAENEEEIKLFEGNADWALIKSLYHDIELIENKLAAPVYIEQVLQTISDNCDPVAGELLRGKILNPKAPANELAKPRKWWQFW